MKKLILLAMVLSLILPSFSLAQLRVLVLDPSGNAIIDNFLDDLQVASAPPVLTLKLKNPVTLPSSNCPQAKINISAKVFDATGALVKDWGVIGTMTIMPSPTPISPAPIPPALTKPTPPFPSCWWGPFPNDQSQLIDYIDGMGNSVQPWANWLKAHPEDLAWAWSEYKKTNP